VLAGACSALAFSVVSIVATGSVLARALLPVAAFAAAAFMASHRRALRNPLLISLVLGVPGGLIAWVGANVLGAVLATQPSARENAVAGVAFALIGWGFVFTTIGGGWVYLLRRRGDEVRPETVFVVAVLMLTTAVLTVWSA
jgi:hypothetical protein